MISGAFVFQSLTLHPTANPVEPSRKPDPFTITPVVRPLKTPSVAFWRKKRKKTRKHQAKPEKRVRIVFMALHNYARKRCAIGFVRSEHRTVQNDKFSPLVRGALTGFPVSKLHISPGQKKTDLGSVARIRVYGKYFSYRMLNIHKRKKCLSDALKQPFQKESALYDARKR